MLGRGCGMEGPLGPDGHLVRGYQARRGQYPSGRCYPSVHRTLFGLMCNHDLSPPPPDLPACRYGPLWCHASMNSGKEVLLLKTILGQVRACRGTGRGP